MYLISWSCGHWVIWPSDRLATWPIPLGNLVILDHLGITWPYGHLYIGLFGRLANWFIYNPLPRQIMMRRRNKKELRGKMTIINTITYLRVTFLATNYQSPWCRCVWRCEFVESFAKIWIEGWAISKAVNQISREDRIVCYLQCSLPDLSEI